MNESTKSALEEINKRLEELKQEKSQVEGTETEVYARIVGYYRAVKNWNRGKKEEYRFRENFRNESLEVSEKTSETAAPARADSASGGMAAVKAANQNEFFFDAEPQSESYLYFYRESCPNCPPVRAWLENCTLRGREIDVDQDSGMLEAALFEVISAPTVIFLDENGKETGRGCNISALDAIAGLSAVAGT